MINDAASVFVLPEASLKEPGATVITASVVLM
jgi:hypothetical protein